jgi:2-succinyl-5-enolpyruvyl-6-hydroxy-3-cyclohexene-1-carboxylate synthase
MTAVAWSGGQSHGLGSRQQRRTTLVWAEVANGTRIHFETLFGTPHGIDLSALARVHGIPVTEVGAAGEVAKALTYAVAIGGVQVVLVRTDRATNVTRHREVWTAVADTVRAS